MSRTLILSSVLVLGVASLSQGESPGAPESRVDANPSPRWFKGNLHTHTLWSDGNDYPEMIVDWYVRHGYQFLALSDHNTLSQGQRWVSVAKADAKAKKAGFDRYHKRFGEHWVETRTVKGNKEVRLKPLSEFRALFEQPGRFLMIQGEELTDRFERKPIHMNASNILEVIAPQGGKSVVEVMRNNLDAIQKQSERVGQPILGHLNHPNFHYGITAEELAMVTAEQFFEIYNGHPGVNQPGDATHAGLERMWDIMNTLRIDGMKSAPLCGLGTDDSHQYFGQAGSSPGRGWIMVRSRYLTPESIIHAIESRDFYASSGVTLREVQYDAKEQVLEVEVEPDGDAQFTTQFIGTLEGYDKTRKPVTDKDGKALEVTQRYSDDVGQVLATVKGTKARYKLTGKELYVRALISSDKAPVNPSFEHQVRQAWTQPVGWEKRVDNQAANP